MGGVATVAGADPRSDARPDRKDGEAGYRAAAERARTELKPQAPANGPAPGGESATAEAGSPRPVTPEPAPGAQPSAGQEPRAPTGAGTPPSSPEGPRVFQTRGGEWRRQANDRPAFYPNGADTAGTEPFDQEYYDAGTDGQTRWVCLNASGSMARSEAFRDRPRPEGVSDFDWRGWEDVSPEAVPAAYSATGRTFEVRAENADAVLRDQRLIMRQYVIDNGLLPNYATGPIPNEDRLVQAIDRAVARGATISATHQRDERRREPLSLTGSAYEQLVGSDRKVYAASVDARSLGILREELSRAREEIAAGQRAGAEGQREATRMADDMLVRAPTNGVLQTMDQVTEMPRAAIGLAGGNPNALITPKLGMTSEYGRKNGWAASTGVQVGLNVVAAPVAAPSRAGQVFFGADAAYNVAVGAGGMDPAERGADGRFREVGAAERLLRIGGGALEFVPALRGAPADDVAPPLRTGEPSPARTVAEPRTASEPRTVGEFTLRRGTAEGAGTKPRGEPPANALDEGVAGDNRGVMLRGDRPEGAQAAAPPVNRGEMPPRPVPDRIPMYRDTDGLPVYTVDYNRTPETALNKYHAIRAREQGLGLTADGTSVVLTHANKAQRTPRRDILDRAEIGNGQSIKLPTGADDPDLVGIWRDEFPFNSTREGGRGAWVGHVPAWEQRLEFRDLNDFRREAGLADGTRYRVRVINLPDNLPR